MRVKITVFYGEEERLISKETRNYDLPTRDEDEGSYFELQDHLTENILEPYAEDGYDLEDDDEEDASIGTDYVAAWVLPNPFESKSEALAFLDDILGDTNLALADLE